MLYPETHTRASRHLAEMLVANKQPVLTPFAFFELVRKMHREESETKLYLRRNAPLQENVGRMKSKLAKLGIIGADPDYRGRLIRVLAVPDLPADGIVCLADPTCYISHLSAMQRWGLTDRNPHALMLTRPDRKRAEALLRARMAQSTDDAQDHPAPLKVMDHPQRVRRRPVRIGTSKHAGASLTSREDGVAMATIGQTFLDMLQRPGLCGGMPHVLDVWAEYAKTYLEEIIVAVDTASNGAAKCRAGYILEERLGLSHPGIGRWKACAQRGSSRTLDPSRDFLPTFSETWMISINA